MNETEATARLFLALWPTEREREALQMYSDQWKWPAAARRTRGERLHLTLHFLGSVPAQRIALLRETLALPWAGCTLLLDQPQVWPGGIAVLEASQVPPELRALHAALGERLAAAGVALEARPYRPHVTFARKAFGARAPQSFAGLRWQVQPQYRLVQTLPGGGYEPLAYFG